MDIITAAAAFAGGVLAEFINSLITRRAMAGRASAALIPLRTLVTGGYMVLLYFISRAFGLNTAAALIGGAAGATAGLIVFTLILMKKRSGKEGED
ncbi:MAG: hypothetical protein IJM18_08015 [Clostridia bacterium]|nr:hypothetical protein [Clostridia bacterium]